MSAPEVVRLKGFKLRPEKRWLWFWPADDTKTPRQSQIDTAPHHVEAKGRAERAWVTAMIRITAL